MSDETWINAKKAVKLGFADEILFDEKKPEPDKKEKPEEPEKPDQEGGDDEGDEKKDDKRPFKPDIDDALYRFPYFGLMLSGARNNQLWQSERHTHLFLIKYS